jgi:hypothetical protein
VERVENKHVVSKQRKLGKPISSPKLGVINEITVPYNNTIVKI